MEDCMKQMWLGRMPSISLNRSFGFRINDNNNVQWGHLLAPSLVKHECGHTGSYCLHCLSSFTSIAVYLTMDAFFVAFLIIDWIVHVAYAFSCCVKCFWSKVVACYIFAFPLYSYCSWTSVFGRVIRCGWGFWVDCYSWKHFCWTIWSICRWPWTLGFAS